MEYTSTAVKTPDRSKRDEWSEGAVMILLDEYESKWLLRNRAKLKGSDWEDIACQVSCRDNGKKHAKTATQCKNKIESMKKKYRVESAVVNNCSAGSSWQFFRRMDCLLKGTSNCSVLKSKGKDIADAFVVEKVQNCDAVDVEEGNQVKGSNHDDFNPIPNDTGFTSPTSKCRNVAERCLKINDLKRKRGFHSEISESIKLLGNSLSKIEEARLQMYRDSEKLRVEAEVRRAEMEVESTQIMAKTQLQIAKLFVKRLSSENNIGGSSSLRGELSVTRETDEKND